ncbi:MAG: hypothetical protein A2086_15590 [Spirochaetes bacterium GWD1_27_9]|nr:MAG: hypothetical protein A2Z98_14250 [Spirochaetes bacterium GWB1_27_13]OHD22496.1 MAG: hypothetical protein A2Y34_06755 [Spirochaetes bacterium GWC1_27_15]OHD42804.1 MAG: hypothetical protein A2086_15590 [Spirochaetes bacterium GWD1_27_9]
MKKIKKINYGFSLMETLIWVGIVGIFVGLVGIAGFAFWDRAKVRACVQEMKIYSAALMDYSETEGGLPTNEEGLKILLEKGYVTKTKFLDPWQNAYVYTQTDDGQGFMIKSLGSDKKEGGAGTAKDLTVSSGTDTEGTGIEE